MKIPTVPRTRLTTVPARIGRTIRTASRARATPPVTTFRLSVAIDSTRSRRLRPRRTQNTDTAAAARNTTTAPTLVNPPKVVLYSQLLHSEGLPLPTFVARSIRIVGMIRWSRAAMKVAMRPRLTGRRNLSGIVRSIAPMAPRAAPATIRITAATGRL